MVIWHVMTYVEEGRWIHMNKRTGILSGALALLLSVALLPACGGSGGSTDSGTATNEPAAEPEKPAITEENYLGDWNVVKASYSGVTLTGDLAGMGLEFGVSFGTDGAVTMSSSGNELAGTWELSGEQAVITLKDAAEGAPKSVTFTLAEDETISATIESNGQSMDLTFAKGADVTSAPEFDPANAKPVTDAAMLEGEWKVDAVGAFGVCISGDFENLSEEDFAGAEAMAGYGLTFKADGTGTFTQNGSTGDSTWETTSEGTTVTSSVLSFSVKEVNGDLMIDLGEMLSSATGSTDSDLGMYIFLTKK